MYLQFMKPITGRRDFEAPWFHRPPSELRGTRSHQSGTSNAAHLGRHERRQNALYPHAKRLVFQSQIFAELVDESLFDLHHTRWKKRENIKRNIIYKHSNARRMFTDADSDKKNLCAGIKRHQRSWHDGRTGGDVQNESLLAFDHLVKNHDAHTSDRNDVAVDEALREGWCIRNLIIANDSAWIRTQVRFYI